MTKTEKLANAFLSGEELSAAQISARFGIANPTAHVADLRSQGFSIYCNPRKNKVTKYRLGTPKRAVVAAGYRFLRTA